MDNLLNLMILIISFLIFLFRILYYLQILQILEYFNRKYLNHLFRRAKDFIFDDIFLNILIIFTIIIHFNKFNALFFKFSFLFLLTLSLIYNLSIYKKRKKFSKKGLKFTKRLKRVFALNIIFFILITILIFRRIYLISYLLFLAPFLLILMNILIYPVEKYINDFYFKDAIKKINEIKPFIIGVTGSYGKTSTKYYIYQFLKDKYPVEMTPESYNTAMGITKFIRENLKKDTKIFIVELAENEVGGFKRLLKLIKPNILVITSVGIQHLEEFKNENKIHNEFNFLINYSILNEDVELIVLNGDDDFLDEFKDKKIKKGSIYKKSDLYGEILEEGLKGTKFKLKYDENEILCETEIVGKESIRNIILSSLVSLHFGLNIAELKEKIKILKPFNHRLNVIDNGNVIIVDDAYNSNPIGAKMAIDLISKYENGRRIVITPGFIELGKREFEENKNLGIYLSKKVDFVFLVGGKRTKPIYDGLLESNFPKENIYIFKNFFEANENLKKFIKQKDLILFENDLPEIYEEI
jgi:UDP-N-acetylmuramoyl-tripeptide--D-alanyl-D-alanine ligase